MGTIGFSIKWIDDMAVTIEEVQEYLDSQNIVVPPGLLNRLISRVMSKQECFDKNGYSDDDVYFIVIYTVAMLSLFGADGRIKSQGAPNGASRSFDFAKLGERWKALRDLIRGVDAAGCVDSIIPPDPERKNCALFISPGVGA